MHNHTKGASLYIVEYMKYLSIYHKSMWKAIRYMSEYIDHNVETLSSDTTWDVPEPWDKAKGAKINTN